MAQHRHVVLSGILGATASAIAKLGLGTGEDALIHRWFTDVCEERILPGDGRDFGEWLVSRVNRLLGEIMIKHGIVLMDKWKSCLAAIEDVAFRLRIVEVDYCAAFEVLPRIVCLVTVIVCNIMMVSFFVKGLVASGSVVGTTLAGAANFAFSALLGAVVWNETFSRTWWMGLASVVVGVVLLSTVQPQNDRDSRTSCHPSIETDSRQSVRTNEPNDESQLRPTSDGTSFLANPFGRSKARSAPVSSSTSTDRAKKQQRTVSGHTSRPPTNRTSFFGRKVKVKQPLLIDRTFCNECPLCEGELFDVHTGRSPMAVADMSPNCFHVMHAKCLKQSGGTPTNAGTNGGRIDGLRSSMSRAGCPICAQSISMWISAKQAAHFAAFWIDRVEACLHAMGPVKDTAGNRQPRPAQDVRDMLQIDTTLTSEQKKYIDDDPNGLGKGLASALEWGGYVDYNGRAREQSRWSKRLRTRGIWSYDVKRDDLWMWDWGNVHPRQRCEGCQLLTRSLPYQCAACKESCEAAFYCSESCQKRDWQRHKMDCENWQRCGPASVKK